jgi:hypothetical protein
MQLRSRSTIALLPALLCLACGTGTTDTGTTDTGTTDTGTSGAGNRQPEVSIAPTPILGPIFTPAGHELRSVAASFLRATLEYDARTAGRLDFLAGLEPLATAGELARLKASGRASLPWRALRARNERTELVVHGISQTTSPAQTVRLFAWVTITTHTDLATLQTLESVTLVLASTGDGWKVDQAHGVGL